MNLWRSSLFVMAALYGQSVSAVLTIGSDFSWLPQQQATQAWPVAAPAAMPDGLRPCCAFGYGLKTQLFGIPVPFYRIGNIAESGMPG